MVGSASDEMLILIKEKSGEWLDNRIKLYGRMENAKVVKFMKEMNILVLPTYYDDEAFPISIL